MTIQEIARAFGMTTKQFAERIGYSRQHLYQNPITLNNRTKAVIQNLHTLNSLMWNMALEEANRKFEERKQAIHDLEQQWKKNGDE